MFHLARRITFGVDVGDFLQLQRAFERDGEMNAAAQVQEIRRARQLLGQLVVDMVVPQDIFHLARQVRQLLHQMLGGGFIQHLALLAQVHRQQEQRRQLAGERLGRRHADFGTRVRDERSGRFARDHGSHHVADGQRLRALALGFALCRQRIGGLARLRNHHSQRVFAHQRIAVTEFAAVIDLDRNSRQAFDHELAGQSGVPAGSARHDAHLAEFLELLGGDIHLVQEDAA